MRHNDLPVLIPSYDPQSQWAPLEEQFVAIEETIHDVIRFKKPKAMVLSGPPGLGKTFRVERIFAQCRLPWEPIRPSARGLIDVLYEREQKGISAPLVIDDYDTAFTNRALLEIFKNILDTRKTRTLSHDVKGGVKRFEVTAGVIFLTNRDLDNPKHFSPSVWLGDIPAIKNRCPVMKLPHDEVLLDEYTMQLAPAILEAMKFRDHRGFDRVLSKVKRQEIIDHYMANRERYKERSPRTIYLLGDLRLITRDDAAWERKRKWQFLIEGDSEQEPK